MCAKSIGPNSSLRARSIMSNKSKTSKKQRGKGVSSWEIVAGVVIVFLAIWGVYSFTQPSPQTTTTTVRTTTGSSAPDFTLQVVGPNGLTSEKVSLSSFRGKVVLLEFMEPWCPHCQNIAPALEKLYQQYAPQNVVFLTVSGPYSGATAADTATFIRNYHSSSIYVYDSSGTTFEAFGVQAFPALFLIDKDGRVAMTYALQAGDQLPPAMATDIARLND
jgi:thiol-disulfide isomerase/thioredoxin